MIDMIVLPFLYVSALFTGYMLGVNGPTRKIYELENRVDELEDLLRKYRQEIDSVLEKDSEEETPESETDDMPELIREPPPTSDHLD
jgi:DNA repair ATPase RecN